MGEPRREVDLALKPLWAERGAELGSEHLESHLPVVAEIASQVDRSHPPAPELALEGVVRRQGGTERGDGIGDGHGRQPVKADHQEYRAGREGALSNRHLSGKSLRPLTRANPARASSTR